MNKERIYLTDITLHVRGYRQTVNFSKVAQKGRMYSPLPTDHLKSQNPTGSGHYQFAFEFPKDLQDKLDRGEAEIMMPSDGLLMYAGNDLVEFLKKQERKKRNESIHRGGTWHDNRK